MSVFASFLVHAALSLECYVCSAATTNEECNQNTQKCQAPLDTCMTVVDTLGKRDYKESGPYKRTCRSADVQAPEFILKGHIKS